MSGPCVERYLRENEVEVSLKRRMIERKNIIILLDACTNCRDQLLLLLLAETGFRIGELLGVRYVEDIDYQGCRIRVEPRTNNENEVRAKYEEDRWTKVSKDTFDILHFYYAKYIGFAKRVRIFVYYLIRRECRTGIDGRCR